MLPKQIVLFSLGIGVPIIQCCMIKSFRVEIQELKEASLKKQKEYRRDLQASEEKLRLYNDFVEMKGLVDEFSKVEKQDNERREREYLFSLHYW